MKRKNDKINWCDVKSEDLTTILREVLTKSDHSPELNNRCVPNFRERCLVSSFFEKHPDAKFAMISCKCRRCNPYVL